MKKLLLLCLSTASLSISLFSQTQDSLDVNNINAGFTAGKPFFWSDSIRGGNHYEVPRGSGSTSIFGGSLWLSGLDQGNNLRVSSFLYDEPIASGPIADTYTAAYDSMYSKVWKVTHAEILYHIAHHTDAGYILPDHIAHWPGNGNTANGEAAILAPFIDQNNNGIYEPALGDFPDICGDQAIFMMYNNEAPGSGTFNNSCSKLRVEYHVLAYARASALDTALDNTVFLKTDIINHASESYHDLYFSNYVIADLGCYQNDHVGCDTALNSFFAYNDLQITDSSTLCPASPHYHGYAHTKVAQGYTFLDRHMSSFISFSSNASPTGGPSTCADTRNMQIGLWRNGTPITYGGNGYQNTATNIPYVYPGDPSNPSEWSELYPQTGSPIQSGSRQVAASTSVGTLAPGQTATINMAYVTSFTDTSAAPLSEVHQLKQDISHIRGLFAQGKACQEGFATGIDDVAADQISLMPNPTYGQLTLKVSDGLIGLSYTLMDMTGRVIEQNIISTTLTTISMSTLSSGIYLLQVSDKTYKVIKE